MLWCAIDLLGTRCQFGVSWKLLRVLKERSKVLTGKKIFLGSGTLILYAKYRQGKVGDI